MSANTVLFKRGSRNASDSEHYGGVENNDWDDTTLNSAYDTAMKIAKAEVAKRVAMSTNSQPENREDQKQDKKIAKGKQHAASSSKSKKEWKEGMACRAVYEDDGLEYEAFVLRILDDLNCVVRFLGYENCEMVSIDSLMPSLGKNERQKQIEQAALEKDDSPNVEFREFKRERVPGAKGGRKQNDQSSQDGQPNLEWKECESDRVPSPGSTEYSYGKKQKSPRKKKSQKQPHFDLPEMPFSMPSMPMRGMMANLNSMDMPLPPPPIALPHDRTDPEEQAVSSMLMSWYMSGYYTGLYQGMKRAKQGRKRV